MKLKQTRQSPLTAGSEQATSVMLMRTALYSSQEERKILSFFLANGENVSPEELENKFSGWLLAKELMVYAENGVIVFEMYPNADVVAAMQISDVEAVVKAKVAQINEDLPLYKRIIKVIIRDEEFKKTASGKIKRKY